MSQTLQWLQKVKPFSLKWIRLAHQKHCTRYVCVSFALAWILPRFKFHKGNSKHNRNVFVTVLVLVFVFVCMEVSTMLPNIYNSVYIHYNTTKLFSLTVCVCLGARAALFTEIARKKQHLLWKMEVHNKYNNLLCIFSRSEENQPGNRFHCLWSADVRNLSQFIW